MRGVCCVTGEERVLGRTHETLHAVFAFALLACVGAPTCPCEVSVCVCLCVCVCVRVCACVGFFFNQVQQWGANNNKESSRIVRQHKPHALTCVGCVFCVECVV